jgi:post-segregation antitoxin (ccd killing protein)
MPSNRCQVRVRLPVRLRQKLVARAAARKIDANTLILGAIAADLRASGRHIHGKPRDSA